MDINKITMYEYKGQLFKTKNEAIAARESYLITKSALFPKDSYKFLDSDYSPISINQIVQQGLEDVSYCYIGNSEILNFILENEIDLHGGLPLNLNKPGYYFYDWDMGNWIDYDEQISNLVNEKRLLQPKENFKK